MQKYKELFRRKATKEEVEYYEKQFKLADKNNKADNKQRKERISINHGRM